MNFDRCHLFARFQSNSIYSEVYGKSEENVGPYLTFKYLFKDCVRFYFSFFSWQLPTYFCDVPIVFFGFYLVLEWERLYIDFAPLIYLELKFPSVVLYLSKD